MPECRPESVSSALDSKLKLDLALFFAGNPDALDSAASLGTWTGYHEAETESALDELCASGLLARSGGIYRLTDQPDLRLELAEFAHHYQTARRSVEDVIAQLERERGAMAERLAELEISTQTIVTSMVEGVLVTDPHLRVRFVNDAAVRILGPEVGRRRGRPVDEVVSAPEVVEALRRSAAEDEQVRSLLVSSSPTGTRYYQIETYPIPAPHGSPYGYACLLADVTEIRELDHLKSDLVGFVSHELRNPLAAVKAWADTLLRTGESLSPERRNQVAKVISREVDRTARMIDGFLDISRIESGRALELAPQEFDAVALAREALETQEAHWSKCPLRLESNAEVIGLSADRDKVLLVLLNLLSNAVKYSPRGGNVTLGVREDGASVAFSVADDGIGIEREQLTRIFTPFYRVRDPDARDVKGTGLGLYLCRHLVEAHGGALSVESEPGSGSTFRFTIPRRGAHDSEG